MPGAAGDMGILPNHAPVLSVLNFGIITVKKSGNEEHFTVAGGVAEVQPDQVTVLADAAENVEEIDVQRLFWQGKKPKKDSKKHRLLTKTGT